MDQDGMRIGQLAQRVGVSAHVLRAWEKRYGLLRPIRTASGYRLYGAADERRVRAVVALRQSGVPASDAALRVLDDERRGDEPRADGEPRGDGEPTAVGAPTTIISRLLTAATGFDEPGAQAALDQALSLPLEAAVNEVLLPFLREVGEEWAAGRLAVAQEHFASGLVRRRLAARTGTWGSGPGPRVLLSCVPGDTHDIALLAFGLLLARRGWRISYLGQDTPARDIVRTADVIHPDLVVLAVSRPEWLVAVGPDLDELPARHLVGFGGAGVDRERVAAMGAHALPGDIVAAVGAAAELVRAPRRRRP